MRNRKQLENVEDYNYRGRLITNNAGCIREMKLRISMEIEALKKRTTLSPVNLTYIKKAAGEVLRLKRY